MKKRVCNYELLRIFVYKYLDVNSCINDLKLIANIKRQCAIIRSWDRCCSSIICWDRRATMLFILLHLTIV